MHGRPASVLVTDLNVETMGNLAHNVELNRHHYSSESEVRRKKLAFRRLRGSSSLAAVWYVVLVAYKLDFGKHGFRWSTIEGCGIGAFELTLIIQHGSVQVPVGFEC